MAEGVFNRNFRNGIVEVSSTARIHGQMAICGACREIRYESNLLMPCPENQRMFGKFGASTKNLSCTEQVFYSPY